MRVAVFHELCIMAMVNIREGCTLRDPTRKYRQINVSSVFLGTINIDDYRPVLLEQNVLDVFWSILPYKAKRQ